jgi:hypothetical protein
MKKHTHNFCKKRHEHSWLWRVATWGFHYPGYRSRHEYAFLSVKDSVLFIKDSHSIDDVGIRFDVFQFDSICLWTFLLVTMQTTVHRFLDRFTVIYFWHNLRMRAEWKQITDCFDLQVEEPYWIKLLVLCNEIIGYCDFIKNIYTVSSVRAVVL